MTMTKTIILSTAAIALTGSAVMLAQAQQQAPQMNPDLASFFVAENPNGTGNLGGLAGADQICQSQARRSSRWFHSTSAESQRSIRSALPSGNRNPRASAARSRPTQCRFRTMLTRRPSSHSIESMDKPSSAFRCPGRT